MKRLVRLLALACLSAALVACGPPRKSVFPPTVTIQELHAVPGKPWKLTVRVQNNSYGEMDFSALDASLHVADLPPMPMGKAIELDVPAFAADVVELEITPTAPMAAAIAAIANKGSSGSVAYRVDGLMMAKPEQEKKQRPFDFQARGWLSPVPGIPDTYR
jgi:hypothetical protein